jgi:hypothetical protein
VEGLDYDKLYKCCEWFFGLPYEKKKNIIKSAWNPENSNLYRGYFPVIDENPSRKEGFEFARDIDPSVAPDNWFYEQSVWPDEDGSFTKQSKSKFFRNKCSNLATLFFISKCPSIFTMLDGRVFQKRVGFHMGTNCYPLLADLFRYSYEIDFIQGHLKKTKSS